MTVFLDSNIVIYMAKEVLPELEADLARGAYGVASVVRIEVYGFQGLDPDEQGLLDDIFEELETLELTGPIIERAIALRQTRKMGLGDAIIAASALEHGLPLMTRNVSDFANIPGLTVLNSFETDEKETPP